MGVFSSVRDKCFWRLILGRRVVCDQLFCTKHLVVQHCASESYFLHLIDGGVLRHQQMKKIRIHVMIFVQESQKWRLVLHELCISLTLNYLNMLNRF